MRCRLGRVVANADGGAMGELTGALAIGSGSGAGIARATTDLCKIDDARNWTLTSSRTVIQHEHGGRSAGWAPSVPARSIVLVGTYPPTACGLATFTSNLRAAIAESGSGWSAKVVRVVDRGEPEASSDVIAQWVTGDAASLRHARERIEWFD